MSDALDGNVIMAVDIFVVLEDEPQIREILDKLSSQSVRGLVLRAIGEFVQGKLRRYPEYTYVSRKEAYGQTFQSDRQRRWFFAALRRGELRIPYQRTGRLRRGWKVVHYGGDAYALENDTPYAGWVQGQQQARMMMLRNWRTVAQIKFEEAQRIERVAAETYNREVRRIVGG
ncbi:MAG: hypothetical protein N2545_00740 [Thermoflexales bacterium]|nr:hypothetical protein [Thermoflexales bacterium]